LRNYSVNWGVLVFLLLYVFMPSAVGGFYTVLFATVLFSIVYLSFKSIKIMQFNGILIAPGSLLFLMAAIMLAVTITLTLNAAFFTPIGLSEIAKPLVFTLFFVFGVNSNLNYSMPEIKKTLILVSKIIIVGQFIIAVDQVFGINTFKVLYDYGKTSTTGDIYSFMRSTGSLYNPNYFAWIILQCGVIIFIFSTKSSRYLWLFVVLLMILLSGSKSMLASFPVALLASGWLKGDRVLVNRKNIYVFFIVVILIYAIYQLLITYPQIFPRLKVLIQLLSGEDESGGGRFAIWETAYTYFLLKEEGTISWMFGMGPIYEFKTLDNGFLYTLFRNGIVGLILHLSLLIYFLVKFYRFEDREFGGLGVQYVLLGSLSELQVESLAGWMSPIHLFLYAGLVFSYEYRRQVASQGSQIDNSVTV